MESKLRGIVFQLLSRHSNALSSPRCRPHKTKVVNNEWFRHSTQSIKINEVWRETSSREIINPPVICRSLLFAGYESKITCASFNLRVQRGILRLLNKKV